MTERNYNIMFFALLFSLFVFIGIGLTIQPSYKYRIISENQGYKTNNYEVVGPNCIKFINRDTQNVTVCGQYEIIESK